MTQRPPSQSQQQLQYITHTNTLLPQPTACRFWNSRRVPATQRHATRQPPETWSLHRKSDLPACPRALPCPALPSQSRAAQAQGEKPTDRPTPPVPPSRQRVLLCRLTSASRSADARSHSMRRGAGFFMSWRGGGLAGAGFGYCCSAPARCDVRRERGRAM